MVGLVPCFLITWRAAVPEGLAATFDVKSPRTLLRRAILRAPTRATSVWPKNNHTANYAAHSAIGSTLMGLAALTIFFGPS